MPEHLRAVLEYEAQLNRRDAGTLPGPPPAADPAASAERLIASVKVELRNRRKLAAMVPELVTPALEAEFVAGVEARIASEAEMLRRQIEHRHYSLAPGSQTAPELVAAHAALIDAQRRGVAIDYSRLFPGRAAPDYSGVETFRLIASSAVAIARTEFGLMRLRTTIGAPNPGETAAFDHIAMNLVLVVRDIGEASDGIRLRGGQHAMMALAMQWFAAAVVAFDGLTPPERLDIARCVQRLARGALMPGGRDAARALIAEIAARAAQSRFLAETWQRCGAEAARFFAS